jgi:ABC-type Zn2+ transport system substrate-binding protein/surface adhesin
MHTQATSRAEAPQELEEARKKLEDRLQAAEEARAASLNQIATRAGEQVQHARVSGGAGKGTHTHIYKHTHTHKHINTHINTHKHTHAHSLYLRT